jgi:hypothetical protein
MRTPLSRRDRYSGTAIPVFAVCQTCFKCAFKSGWASTNKNPVGRSPWNRSNLRPSLSRFSSNGGPHLHHRSLSRAAVRSIRQPLPGRNRQPHATRPQQCAVPRCVGSMPLLRAAVPPRRRHGVISCACQWVAPHCVRPGCSTGRARSHTMWEKVQASRASFAHRTTNSVEWLRGARPPLAAAR